MTRYILSGGYPWKAADGGKAFAQAVVQGFREPVQILECLFARSRDAWDQALSSDKEMFATLLPDTRVQLQLAEPETFIEQIRSADVVYIRGGDWDPLVAALGKSPGWEKVLDGKTLVGGSAGAMLIAKYDYDIDALKLHEGLGLLPVKAQVHYRSDYNAPNVDWDKADAELKNYREDLPILNLGEGEFEVIEQ